MKGYEQIYTCIVFLLSSVWISVPGFEPVPSHVGEPKRAKGLGLRDDDGDDDDDDDDDVVVDDVVDGCFDGVLCFRSWQLAMDDTTTSGQPLP